MVDAENDGQPTALADGDDGDGTDDEDGVTFASPLVGGRTGLAPDGEVEDYLTPPIELERPYLVLGPDSTLTLRAGVAVAVFDGVGFGPGSQVAIEIDPALIP